MEASLCTNIMKNYNESQTAKSIATQLRNGQVSWINVTTKLTELVDSTEFAFEPDMVNLAKAIGGQMQINEFEYARPSMRDLVDAVVTAGLDKKETKEFVSTLITSAGFEDYSGALYTRHLGRHFTKDKTNDGSNAKSTEDKKKKAVSEVILSLIENIESAEGAVACKVALEAKLAELSK